MYLIYSAKREIFDWDFLDNMPKRALNLTNMNFYQEVMQLPLILILDTFYDGKLWSIITSRLGNWILLQTTQTVGVRPKQTFTSFYLVISREIMKALIELYTPYSTQVWGFLTSGQKTYCKFLLSKLKHLTQGNKASEKLF